MEIASSSASSKSAVAVPKAAAGSQTFELPWVERYRPHLLADVVGNSEIIGRLRAIAEDGCMPNLILSGPPGTGKTTSVVALARCLLGDAFKDAVLELNASDERGIDVVRTKIKMFAQKKVTLPPGRHKVIILDEADSMTAAAQQAMRRTMELYSSTTRFALACNNSSKVIEPIQSRCAILRFSRLSDQEVLSRLLHVCEAERLAYDDSGLEALIFTAEGDMRNALNNVQACVSGFEFVNATNVFKIADQPHPLAVKEIIACCVAKDIYGAKDKLAALWAKGYSGFDIIGTLFKVTKFFDMGEALKLEFIREIGFAHMRIADGVGSLLQLVGLCGRLCQLQQ